MTAPGPVAIIAGGGAFPLEVAEAARAAGRDVTVIGLRGFADKLLRRFPYVAVDMLDPGGMIAALRTSAPSCVVLAGAVTRPGPLAIGSVFSAYRNREDLARILSAGDDRLLRGVVDLIEEAGFRVAGAQEIAPSVLAPAAVLGAVSPSQAAGADIDRGRALLAAIGPWDVGQAVVVSAGRVLAVEGPEGTDATLDRVLDLQRRKRVKLDGQGGVLVKIPKPGQDVRIDLPAIGPRTIGKARAAGLSGVAVQAGGVVLVDRAGLIREADRAGLFVMGFS